MRPETLPHPTTSFLGREEDLAALSEMLADPACRLLTVVGPGGIGKTRLAVQAASEKAADFAHGVIFVDLQPLQQNTFLPAAIADALDFPLSGTAEPQAQLLDHLAERELLLLLDNFEQCLSNEDAASSLSLLSALLRAALDLKVLVTSRVALNLQEEWLYPLRGLAAPSEKEDETAVSQSAAVQLFVDRARHVRPNFSLETHSAAVGRLCRLVEGMPLALELAASWTRMLDPAEILAEIQQNLDFLATRLHNVPERQRSIQAVFAQMWQLLIPEEREAFRRLAVFRGDFGREAAAAVSGATLPTLRGLVDKSLLRWENGRYRFHELLRQYGAEQLAHSPEVVSETREAHAAYYAAFLARRRDDLMGGRQQEALAEIEPELKNIRAMWQWAVSQARLDLLDKSVQTLANFYQFRSRYLEGAEVLAQAGAVLQTIAETAQRDEVWLQILLEQAWFYIRLGRLAEAESLLDQCDAIYERRQIPPLSGHGTDPTLHRGIIASIRGDYEGAARLGERVRQRSAAPEQLWNRQFAYYLLAQAALARGDYEEAERRARRAHRLVQETGDDWFMAYCHNELGSVARGQGDYEAAKRHFKASYALRQTFPDPEGMAVALNHLGETAVLQEEYDEARRLYRRARAIYREINDKGGLAASLAGLARADCARGDYREARRHLHQALQLATEIRFVPLVCSLLLTVGELMLETGEGKRGLALLAFLQAHPAADQQSKDQAEQLLSRYETVVPAPVFREAIAHPRAREEEITAVANQLLVHLAPRPEEIPSAKVDGVPPEQQQLAEPLTQRELEVLGLIAQGMTNREVAEELVISVGTVKWYTSQIYGKLDVGNRTAAVARARELELLAE